MKQKRLLIVDDDPLVCQALKEMAESSDFDVITTDTKVAFFAQLVLFEPDIIILDLLVPDSDGMHIIRQLSDLNNNAQLIIVSGLETSVLKAAAQMATELGLGVLGILQKPVTLERMRQLLLLYLNTNARRPGKTAHWQDQLDNRDWMPTQADLIEVIEKDLLTLNYQPILDCRTGTLVGFEALARWEIPGRGSITPDVFVPLAENSNLMSALTNNIARQGICWLGEIQRNNAVSVCSVIPGFSQQTLGLSLNITAQCLQDSDLPEQLEEICKECQVDPASITLEISESSAMDDPITLLETLTRFRLKKFQLSIDDFGTGYSSMLHLVRLPFTEIKIDKEFVGIADSSDEARSVIKCVIDLSRSLGMTTVAEGVETEQTRQLLARCGCTAFQGYLVSKPLSAEHIPAWAQRYCDERKE